MKRLAWGLATLVCACGVAADQQAPFSGAAGAPLAGIAARGARVFDDRERGHCVLCHTLTASDAPFQGNLGPPLDQIGDRLSPGQLRYRIVDMGRINADTRMPAYFRTHGLTRVASAYAGKPVLSAQEVEDVVAWLAAQRANAGGQP